MKKQLKRIAALGIFASLLFVSSCRKDETPPPAPINTNNTNTPQYYIRFKIDGVQKQYTANPTTAAYVNLPPIQPDSMYYTLMSAYANSADLTRNCMVISLHDEVPVVPNIPYTNFVPTSSSGEQKLWAFSILYKDENGLQSVNFGEPLFTSLGLTSDARLRITDLTATSIRATFSASLYDSTYSTVTHLLTEGELYIHRLQ